MFNHQRADLAICDFTITYERKKVIDFSSPFMTLGKEQSFILYFLFEFLKKFCDDNFFSEFSGISILYAKPGKEPPDWSNFLKPLDTTVWLYMSTAFLCVSIAEFCLAR